MLSKYEACYPNISPNISVLSKFPPPEEACYPNFSVLSKSWECQLALPGSLENRWKHLCFHYFCLSGDHLAPSECFQCDNVASSMPPGGFSKPSGVPSRPPSGLQESPRRSPRASRRSPKVPRRSPKTSRWSPKGRLAAKRGRRQGRSLKIYIYYLYIYIYIV